MARFYDLWRQVYQSKFHPFRNNVTLPLLYAAVQSSVAQKAAMLLNFPYITMLAGGPEDMAVARRQETLVNRQLEDSKTYEKGIKFLTQADVYGTAWYRWYWRVDEGETTIRFDLGSGETSETRPYTKFNGPDWEPIDVVDIFPAPGFSSMDDMPWVVHRYWMELEDIAVQAEMDFFDREGVQDLTYSPGMARPLTEALAWRRNIATATADEKDVKLDQFSRPVEILEFWGRVPRDLAPDGETSRVITVANRRHLLRSRPNPYYDREIPFGYHTPTPDPHYLHAPGKVEIAAKLQYASNRIANQKLDALDLNLDPVWLASKRSGLDPRNMRLRPGKVLWADREIGPDMIQPLIPDLGKMQHAYAELQQQSQWIQQGTGIIDDAVQGLSSGGSDRQTAREFLGRQESASRRILAEVRMAEKQWMEPLGRRFVAMNRQFLPFPQTIRMIGADAVLDPLTLMPIDPMHQPTEIQVNDMLPDYDVRAVGATRQLGTQARQQNMILLLQALQTNPIAAASVNWMVFFRQLFKTFDIQNVDEMLNTNPLAVLAVAQAIQGAQAPGNGNGAPQGGGEAAVGLSPVLSGVVGNPELGGSSQNG